LLAHGRAFDGDLDYFWSWAAAELGLPEVYPAPAAAVQQFVTDHLRGLPTATDRVLVDAGVKAAPARGSGATPAARLAGLEYGTMAPMLATCGEDLTGRRDRALLLLAWASGGLRRGQLAAARVEDLTPIEAGTPAVVLGCNSRICLGATTYPMDVTDVYLEQLVANRRPVCPPPPSSRASPRPSSDQIPMGASAGQCPGGEQVGRYSSVTVWRGVCLTHQRRHKKDGKTLSIHGRTTLVFIKQSGQWKIVSAHFPAIPKAL
jgi:hypothetical protein